LTGSDVEVLYCAQHGGFSLSSKVVKELYRWYPDLFKQLELDPVDSKIIDEAAFLRPESNLRGADGKVQYITNSDFERTDRRVINVVKEIGLKESSGANYYCAGWVRIRNRGV